MSGGLLELAGDALRSGPALAVVLTTYRPGKEFQPLYLILNVLWLVGLILIILTLWSHEARVLRASMNRLAAAWQGSCEVRSRFAPDSRLHFSLRGCDFRVEIVPGPRTQFVGPWPDRKFACVITPERYRPLPPQLLWSEGRPDQGPTRFLSDWDVTTNDPAQLLQFLTLEVRAVLKRLPLVSEVRRNKVALRISEGEMSVSCPGVLADHKRLKRFVEAALDLYRHGVWEFPTDNDIQIVDPASPDANTRPARLDEPVPTCPICGEQLGAVTLLCDACGTAYHPECWDYHGQCAIYGCPCDCVHFETVTDAPQPLAPDSCARGT